MNAPHRFYLLGLVIAAVLPLQQGKAADPEHKPQLAPRAIPGMSKRATPGASTSASAAKAGPTKAQLSSAANERNNPLQAHIIAIYRRGTIPLPPVPAGAETPADSSTQITPAPPAAPPPGKVRILTKEEAEKLAK